MYRVSSERVTLDLDGPSVEVEPIRSWTIYYQCLATWDAFVKAANGSAAEYSALQTLFEQFAVLSQAQWDIGDSRGPVPVTAQGMARLPHNLSLAILAAWRDTFAVEKEETSAVDELIPPGPARREIKRRLKSVKAA